MAMSFADALGTGLFLPLSVIYLTRIVGLSPTRVGLGLTIAGVLAIAAAPLSGALLGRFDARKVVLGCFAASACGFLAYIAVGSFASFLGVAIVIQFASRMDRPAATVLTLGVTSKQRQVDTLAWQYSLRNLGYGAGGLFAALALLAHGKTPFEVLLGANAASYVLAGVLVLQLPAVRPPSRAEGEPTGYGEVIRDRPYLGLALLNVIMALHDSLLVVAMPLWILTRTHAPLSLTGLLFALNTILVVLFQVRTTRNMAARGGIARGYRTAAVSFVVACGAFALAAGAPAVVATVLLVLAISALTTAELVTSAGEWFLSVQLAPTRLSAPYVSVFKTSMAVQQAVGPVFVTAVLVGWGRLGWCALALLLGAGTLTSRRLGAREFDRRVSPVPATHPAVHSGIAADEQSRGWGGGELGLVLPVPPPVAYQHDEADQHQYSERFDHQAEDDGDHRDAIAVDQRRAEPPPPLRLADPKWLAERDYVGPGRTHSGAAGLQGAVGAGVAAVLGAVRLVGERVERDRPPGAGQVRNSVDRGGYGDHGHEQDDQHPGPAHDPQD
jgi:Major Facilitator Superfamily